MTDAPGEDLPDDGAVDNTYLFMFLSVSVPACGLTEVRVMSKKDRGVSWMNFVFDTDEPLTPYSQGQVAHVATQIRQGLAGDDSECLKWTTPDEPIRFRYPDASSLVLRHLGLTPGAILKLNTKINETMP